MKLMRGANAGGWAWYLFNTIENPDQGWDFIKFFLQDENVNEGWAGSLPPGTAQLELPLYADNPRYEFVTEVLGYSKRSATADLPGVAGAEPPLDVPTAQAAGAPGGGTGPADAPHAADAPRAAEGCILMPRKSCHICATA